MFDQQKEGSYLLRRITKKKQLNNLLDQPKFKQYTNPINLKNLIKKYQNHFKEELNLIFNQYITLIDKILNEQKKPKNKYKNGKGLILFVQENFEDGVNATNIKNAFRMVRTFLDKKTFIQLNWEKPISLKGSFKYKPLTSSIPLILLLTEGILNKEGKLRDEYKHLNGLAKFAKEFFQDDMRAAFKSLSAVLKKNTFIQLGWNSFSSSVNEFEKLKDFISNKLVDKYNNPNSEYIGMSGQLKVAKKFPKGKLSEVFTNFSVLFEENKNPFFNKLNWGSFIGSANEYRLLKWIIQNVLFDQEGNPNSNYINPKGFILFVETLNIFGGNLTRAYVNISAVVKSLKKYRFRRLRWRKFFGDLDEFKQLQLIVQNVLFDQFGNLNPKYVGVDGLALFAKEHYEGKMRNAFFNVSFLINNNDIFSLLNWGPHFSLDSEYKRLEQLIPNVLLDENGNPNSKYIGMDGLALFAEEYFEGNMKKAFLNISAINEDLTQLLLWKAFYGFVADYKTLKNLIFSDLLDENGNLNPEYIGMDGLIRFIQFIEKDPNRHTKYMEYIYYNVFNLLSEVNEKIFPQFKWNKFNGLVIEFERIRDIIQKSSLFNRKGNFNPAYRGEKGLFLFIKENFKDEKLTLNFLKKILGVLGKKHFKTLGWKRKYAPRKLNDEFDLDLIQRFKEKNN